jgi:hypothetical protein
MKKEDVIETLRSLGFDPQDNENDSFSLGFENLTVLYMWDEDDEDFYRAAIPAIFEVNDENREMVMELVNRANMRMKFTKTTIYGDSVWIFYEASIWDDSLMEAIIEHSVYLLKATFYYFHSMIEGNEHDLTSDEKDDDSNNEE